MFALYRPKKEATVGEKEEARHPIARRGRMSDFWGWFVIGLLFLLALGLGAFIGAWWITRGMFR